MKRCVILSAAPVWNTRGMRELIEEGDMIICADGGVKLAEKLGVRPSLILGDFDSLDEVPHGAPVMTYQVEKDDTDTMLAVKQGIAYGCGYFLLLGCTGGGFDHTYANIQALCYLTNHGCEGYLMDADNIATMITNTTVEVKRQPGFKLSLFAYSERCEGVTIRGVKYPLTDYTLLHSFPLGARNEILEEKAEITVKKGTLLIVLSREANTI
ncbi:thiamine diphosphokinase [Zongyangia hominis]|uniref:Thiamine diphosphokinase n=1 Tax=Zongyangia hominis TaxID=2763677 RepID=A0A926ED71_9FIRM|nr:thiamine diphosphokinase [Zongyangia hominis]MBC8570908.1 thiamine diphosphokinase [Zongyangia hominis]